jgi:AcrR family transcriptional regulator
MTAVMRSNRALAQSELRAIIYEAALKRFREQGYARTTVDAIVATAGVAKGTFFNFFPAKLDVLKTYYGAIDAEAARCRARMNAAAPLDSLRRYASRVEAVFLREGPLMFELIDAIAHEPVMTRIDAESGANDAADFARFLREVRNRGLIAASVDVGAAANAVLDLWSGSVRAWLARPMKGSLARLFHERVRLLFHGLGYEA